MKKIMIALAIVAVAAVSQAASWKWSASGVMGPGSQSETPFSGAAILYYADAGQDNWKVAYDTTMTDGAILAADNVFTLDDTTNPNRYDFKYTMTATGVDGKDWTFEAVKANVLAQKSSTAQIGFGSNGTWTAAPVPEPTSGLLLLLGVAGLALKRKRA